MKTPASGGIDVQSTTAPVETKKASSRLNKLIRADGRPRRPGAEHAGGHVLTNTAPGSPVKGGKAKRSLSHKIFPFFSKAGTAPRASRTVWVLHRGWTQWAQCQQLHATPPPQLPTTRCTTVRSCLGRDPNQRPRGQHPEAVSRLCFAPCGRENLADSRPNRCGSRPRVLRESHAKAAALYILCFAPCGEAWRRMRAGSTTRSRRCLVASTERLAG